MIFHEIMSKSLKVNHGNTKMIISEIITKDGFSKNKVYLCGICSLRVEAKSVL